MITQSTIDPNESSLIKIETGSFKKHLDIEKESAHIHEQLIQKNS